jgi:hypothetical protein
MSTEPTRALEALSLDRLGVACAGLCAVHCVVTPFLFAAMPFAGVEIVAGKGLEWGFMGGLALGSMSLIPSFRRLHRRLLPLVLFAAGVALWLGARLGAGSDSVSELPLVIIGAASLIAAHVVNRRLCRSCRMCGDHVAGGPPRRAIRGDH